MKKILTTLCLILLTSSLAACSESVGNRNEGDVLPNNNAISDNQAALSGSSVQAERLDPSGISDTPHMPLSGTAAPNEQVYSSERLNMDLGNNIIIDAEVRTPTVGNFNVMQVVPHTFNDAARELLLGEDNGSHIFNNHADDWDKFISLYPTDYESSVINVFQTLLSAQMTDGDPGIMSGDLDFMTGAEAAQIVSDFFRSIGITAQPTAIYSMDTGAIRTGVELSRTEYGMDMPDYTTFSESYVIYLTQVLNGVPLYSGNYPVELRAGTEMAQGIYGRTPSINAVVTEAGIVQLYAGSLFDIASTERQPTELITPEQAIETVRAAFADIINVETLYINDIELVYTILPQSLQELDSLEAWPVWVFTTSQQQFFDGGRRGGAGYFTQESSVFVCAIDGIILRDRFR